MEVFQSWSTWSKDCGQHIPQLPPLRPVTEILNEAGVAEGQTVLDVGAGIGWVTIPIADRVKPNGKVIALEPAEDSRKELLRYAQNFDVEDLVSIVDGEAKEVPLDNEAVDIVITRSVLCYVEGKEDAIAEFWRVLCMDGTFVCWEPLNRYGYLRKAGFFHSRYLQGLGDLGIRVSQLMTQCVETYCREMNDFTEHDLLEMCWNAGFRDVSVKADRSIRRHTFKGDNPLEAIGWDNRGAATQPTPHEYLAKHLSDEELEVFRSYVVRLFETEEVVVPFDGGRCLLKAIK